MTAHEFSIWLNGYVELGGKTPDDAQWKMITEHLKLVFNKVTPELGDKSTWEDKKVSGGNTILGKPDDIKKIMDSIRSLPPQPPVVTLPYYPPHTTTPYVAPQFPGTTVTC